MSRYLDLVRVARTEEDGPSEQADRDRLSTPEQGDSGSTSGVVADMQHRLLVAAGYKPKVRCGKTIWQSPENGFWYSREMALQLSKEGA